MYIIMKMMVVYYLSNKERVVSMDLSEERNEERFQWIRNDIEFDFPIPTILKNTIEEIEEADRTGDMVEYNSLADCIDIIAKGFCTTGLYTEEQWDMVCRKYPIVV